MRKDIFEKIAFYLMTITAISVFSIVGYIFIGKYIFLILMIMMGIALIIFCGTSLFMRTPTPEGESEAYKEQNYPFHQFASKPIVRTWYKCHQLVLDFPCIIFGKRTKKLKQIIEHTCSTNNHALHVKSIISKEKL